MEFDDNGRLELIVVAFPYSGVTERGIGLGATASQIEEIYGTEYEFDEEENYFYIYESLGIGFVLDWDSGTCIAIGIFPPNTYEL